MVTYVLPRGSVRVGERKDDRRQLLAAGLREVAAMAYHVIVVVFHYLGRYGAYRVLHRTQ